MDSTYFETRYAPHPDRSRVWRAICEYLQPYIAPSSVVMDVGAGYCDFINQIHARARFAVDVNPEAARWCAPEVSFVHAMPIENIDHPARSVDVVMMSNLLEHLAATQCSVLLAAIVTRTILSANQRRLCSGTIGTTLSKV